MSQLLYISDVFCPWCFGFVPVLSQLRRDHPELPVRVLAGSLVEEPTTIARMRERSPNIRDFFLRLEKTTGRSAAAFIHLLDTDSPILMHSPEINRTLVALKRLVPGNALLQLETFQNALYGMGKDILNPDVQRDLVTSLGADADSCALLLKDPAVAEEAVSETETALDILDEFPVYPTLFLENGMERMPLTRGYAPYETVRARLDAALTGGEKQNGDYTEGAACGLDGTCC